MPCFLFEFSIFESSSLFFFNIITIINFNPPPPVTKLQQKVDTHGGKIDKLVSKADWLYKIILNQQFNVLSLQIMHKLKTLAKVPRFPDIPANLQPAHFTALVNFHAGHQHDRNDVSHPACPRFLPKCAGTAAGCDHSLAAFHKDIDQHAPAVALDADTADGLKEALVIIEATLKTAGKPFAIAT